MREVSLIFAFIRYNDHSILNLLYCRHFLLWFCSHLHPSYIKLKQARTLDKERLL